MNYKDPEYKRNRAIVLSDAPNCAICGRPGADTADHIVPLDAGGDHSLDNLRPAHGTCNSRLGAIHGNRKTAQRIQTRNQAVRASEVSLSSQAFTPSPHAVKPPEVADRQGSAENVAVGDGLGRIEPRLVTPVEAGPSLVPSLIEFASRVMRLELMPHQQRVLHDMLRTDDNGNLLFREALVSTARQQGKSEALKALIGWWLAVEAVRRGRPQNVLLVANKLDRTMAMFRALAEVLEPAFGCTVRWSNGAAAIVMTDGSTLKLAAAKDNHHGSTNDLICVDEIWDVGPGVIYDALRPTMIARPNPMLAMWSTAGDQSSTLMLQLREQAITAIDAGRRGRLYFAEWSPPPGIDPTDRKWWPWANPALGRTVSWDALEAAYESPDRTSFLRAHMNLWITSAESWLPHGLWDTLEVPEKPVGGVLSVEASLDGSRYVGIRAGVVADVVVATVEFVVESEAAMWQAVEATMADPTVQLTVPPNLEIHCPLPLRRRMTIVGYGELLKWTATVRSMIVEGRLRHNGGTLLAEHVNRTVLGKQAQGVAPSSQKSPGPIEACRAMIWAAALASRPISKTRPAFATG